MYVHPRPGLTAAVIRALEETGNRGIVGRGFITTGADVGVPVPLIENADHALSDAADLISAHNHDEALVRVGLAPSRSRTPSRRRASTGGRNVDEQQR
jgi:5-methylthioadenosine/S-adenosylhomocysteine deaminase